MASQYDREREQIEQDFGAGLIDNVEYWRRMHEVNRAERDDMQEAAARARRDAMENW